MTLPLCTTFTAVLLAGVSSGAADASDTDHRLTAVLRDAGLPGRVQHRLEERLGCKLEPARTDLGRLLFFDRLLGIKLDNACAGCHSPSHGFGYSQPIAIGIDTKNLVGPQSNGVRTGEVNHPSADLSVMHSRSRGAFHAITANSARQVR
jgi:cytochrome c peroxidase